MGWGPESVTSFKEGPQKLSHHSYAYILTDGPEISHMTALSAREAGVLAVMCPWELGALRGEQGSWSWQPATSVKVVRKVSVKAQIRAI